MSCPAGYTKTPDNEKCYKFVETGERLSCDPGFTYSARGCLDSQGRGSNNVYCGNRRATQTEYVEGRCGSFSVVEPSAAGPSGVTTTESSYAEFSDVSKELEETNKVLNPRRPKVAPAEDLSRERELILRGPTIDILMIQVALFFAVLSLLSFLVFSRDVAQGVSFLLLCTGVAIGFFLRK